MPQTSMDWWTVAGVVVAIVAAIIAWRQYKSSRAKTTNEIKRGNRDLQDGGTGSTINRIEDGDDNQQKG